MKVYTRIYLVEDWFDQRAFATCEESGDKIQICGLKDSGGNPCYFEAEAYHLEEWCITEGFTYKCIEKEYDFDQPKDWIINRPFFFYFLSGGKLR